MIIHYYPNLDHPNVIHPKKARNTKNNVGDKLTFFTGNFTAEERVAEEFAYGWGPSSLKWVAFSHENELKNKVRQLGAKKETIHSNSSLACFDS